MRTLDDWLDYQLRLHPQAIALGLERVRMAWHALGSPVALRRAIVVAGTNGKGSTAAYLEAMLRAAGFRVGTYSSPHLMRYNERVRIDGREATDAELVAAFERVEHARAEVPLTYFEFGTLAAFVAFEAADVDIAVLEVGLGGRLDAVNIVDGVAAIVTTIDLDHQALLGSDRERIAREKAGIWRAGRPAIVAERMPPDALLDAAREAGAVPERLGYDFDFEGDDAGWSWRHRDGTRHALPATGITGPAQRQNAAGAIAALHALREELPVPHAALAAGVGGAHLRGRIERVADAPETIVDVAHNAQAAATLGRWLAAAPRRPTHAVFAALADKDIEAIGAALAAHIDAWHVAGLERESERGADAEATARRLGQPAERYASVAQALEAARQAAGGEGRVVAFGSFLTAAAVLRALAPR